MGEFLSLFAAFGIQLLVESHSDHILNKHILLVSIKQNDVPLGDLSIENYFSLCGFIQKLQSLRGPMKSWEDFFHVVESQYKWVECTDEARISLRRQAFEQALADRIISWIMVCRRIGNKET
jgi:hypothetical protein